MSTHPPPSADSGPPDPMLQHSYGPELAANEHSSKPHPEVLSPPPGSLNHSQGQTSNDDNKFFYAAHHHPYQQQQHMAGLNPGDKYPVTPSSGWGPAGATRRICGMTATVFWIVVGAVVLLVLGIALGAGLGVGLSSRNQSAPSSSSSSTSTSTTATAAQQTTTTTSSSSSKPTGSATTSASPAYVTSGTHGLAANSCNSTTPRTYEIPHTDDSSSVVGFTSYCFTDWPRGDKAADGSGTVDDLEYLTRYTFESCMQACVDYNDALESGATGCYAITYNSNLTSIIEKGQQGGNCFLKTKKGVDMQGSAESACAALAL